METSVEFLERMYKSFNMITPNDLKIAKELEKQHIITAYLEGAGSSIYAYTDYAQEYYKETFNK